MNVLRFQAKESSLLGFLVIAAASASAGDLSGTAVAIILSSLAAVAVLPRSNSYIE